MKLKNLLLIALVAIVFCGCQSNYQPTSITVASYNLRNANGGDSINGNGWGQRYPVIAQIVQYHDFDIFGTAEPADSASASAPAVPAAPQKFVVQKEMPSEFLITFEYIQPVEKKNAPEEQSEEE